MDEPPPGWLPSRGERPLRSPGPGERRALCDSEDAAFLGEPLLSSLSFLCEEECEEEEEEVFPLSLEDEW